MHPFRPPAKLPGLNAPCPSGCPSVSAQALAADRIEASRAAETVRQMQVALGREVQKWAKQGFAPAAARAGGAGAGAGGEGAGRERRRSSREGGGGGGGRKAEALASLRASLRELKGYADPAGGPPGGSVESARILLDTARRALSETPHRSRSFARAVPRSFPHRHDQSTARIQGSRR